MERRAAAFFLIQIILWITTSGAAVSRSRRWLPLNPRNSGQHQRQNDVSIDRQRRSPSHLENFSFLTGHRGNYGGGHGRPIYGSPDLRSVDNVPPDPHQYWDFVLGSGTFKRQPKQSAFDRGRVRRDTTSAGSHEPFVDVQIGSVWRHNFKMAAKRRHFRRKLRAVLSGNYYHDTTTPWHYFRRKSRAIPRRSNRIRMTSVMFFTSLCIDWRSRIFFWFGVIISR